MSDNVFDDGPGGLWDDEADQISDSARPRLRALQPTSPGSSPAPAAGAAIDLAARRAERVAAVAARRHPRPGLLLVGAIAAVVAIGAPLALGAHRQPPAATIEPSLSASALALQGIVSARHVEDAQRAAQAASAARRRATRARLARRHAAAAKRRARNRRERAPTTTATSSAVAQRQPTTTVAAPPTAAATPATPPPSPPPPAPAAGTQSSSSQASAEFGFEG